MGATVTCELCLTEPRLVLSLRFTPLMVFHVVLDHDWPIEQAERLHRMVLPSGDVIWGLGSLGRKRAHFGVWRVRTEDGRGKA